MRFGVLVLTLFAATGASAQGGDAWPQAVEAAVRATVGQAWSVDPDRVVLDWGATGGNAVPADGPVELTGSGLSGYWVARIGATGDGGLAVRVRAGHRIREPIAARRLNRGEALVSSDIAWEDQVVWGPPTGTVEVPMEGWVTRRVVERGSTLAPPAVRPPQVVAPGGPVELVWSSGAVRVRLTGEAAGAGGVGDEVYVRTEGGARLRGVIVAPGVVDVSRSGSLALQGNAR